MLNIASLPVPPAPLKLRHNGALQMFYYNIIIITIMPVFNSRTQSSGLLETGDTSTFSLFKKGTPYLARVLSSIQ